MQSHGQYTEKRIRESEPGDLEIAVPPKRRRGTGAELDIAHDLESASLVGMDSHISAGQVPTVKSGKFSAIESQQLKEAIEIYRVRENLDSTQMMEKIMGKRQHKDMAFWREIVSVVPHRSVKSITAHVQRDYHPLAKLGEWDANEDKELKAAVLAFGTRWTQVSQKVGRTAEDCRDRYRNYVSHQESRTHGKWSPEEEAQLIEIVTRLENNGSPIEFWAHVSSLMGHKRGRQQCLQKWNDSLSRNMKNKGVKPIWTEYDTYLLVQKIDALNVDDDTEIDFKSLPCPGWDLWSGRSLQRRWAHLKTVFLKDGPKSHRDLMAILRVQYSTPPVNKRRARKNKPSALVESSRSPGTSGSSGGSVPTEISGRE